MNVLGNVVEDPGGGQAHAFLRSAQSVRENSGNTQSINQVSILSVGGIIDWDSSLVGIVYC
mgnify:CR=1 FL=1